MRDLDSIVLASASPRRFELLRSLGLHVHVVPSGVVEGARAELDSAALAAYHASQKAAAVAADEPAAVIVAADTVVDVDGAALGKPRDADEAATMLRLLGGREHVVYTAYCVLDTTSGRRIAATSATGVRFVTLDAPTIAAYVATGEPFDKAGAYGIQGRGAALVERIEGDFHTVMGFPLGDFVRRLPKLGLRLPATNRAVPA